jgi:hypothetical protein
VITSREFHDLPEEIRLWLIGRAAMYAERITMELQLSHAFVKVTLPLEDPFLGLAFTNRMDLEDFLFATTKGEYPSDAAWGTDADAFKVSIPLTDLGVVLSMLATWNDLYLDGADDKRREYLALAAKGSGGNSDDDRRKEEEER